MRLSMFDTPIYQGFSEEKHYQNKLVVKENKIARYSNVRNENIFRREWTFTIGSQVKVESQTEKENIVVFSKPSSAIDWLKSLIVEFEPTLKFGWLIPKTIDVKLEQDIHHHETYYNVLPTPKQFSDRSVTTYLRLTEDYDMCNISEIDLLDSMPVTRSEVRKERDRSINIKAYLTAFNDY
jgi:hypothetical protein